MNNHSDRQQENNAGVHPCEARRRLSEIIAAISTLREDLALAPVSDGVMPPRPAVAALDGALVALTPARRAILEWEEKAHYERLQQQQANAEGGEA